MDENWQRLKTRGKSRIIPSAVYMGDLGTKACSWAAGSQKTLISTQQKNLHRQRSLCLWHAPALFQEMLML